MGREGTASTTSSMMLPLWGVKLSGFSSLTPSVMCDNITTSFAQNSKHLLEGKSPDLARLFSGIRVDK